jgi:hypothetical protein
MELKEKIPTDVYDNYAKVGYNFIKYCTENELNDLLKIMEVEQ